jgi:hypothetical protein
MATRTRRPNAAERRVARILAWEREQRAMPGVFIPGLRLKNPLNNRRGWRAVWGASKEARGAVASAVFVENLCRENRGDEPFRPPCVVTMTRYGVGVMDEGCGLNASLKPARDGIADALGVKDNDPRIEWRYAQERAPTYACRITIEPREVR